MNQKQERKILNAEMKEATRLTREGRLPDAMALIRRRLSLGEPAQSNARTRVVEPPQIGAPPEHRSEPAPAEEPVGAAPRPHATSWKDGLPKPFNLHGRVRGPWLRQVPAEAIAPANGRWIQGSYSGAAGRRAYRLYVPSACQGQPLPLVVMLHGCIQSPDDFAAGTRMNFVGEEAGLLVVYPEQAAAANSSRCWNWFQAAHQQRNQGEPSLIAGITRQVMAEYQVEAGRVFVAGLSAGGAMAAIMAAVYPDIFAAVGVHSGLAPGIAHDLPSAFQAMQQGGTGGGPTANAAIRPMILFQGDCDATVHPRNAQELIRQWTRMPSPQAATVRQGEAAGGRAYTCAIYHDARGNGIVEAWTIHGAGHAWSGGGQQGSFTDAAGPDASREMVRFFQDRRGNQAATGD